MTVFNVNNSGWKTKNYPLFTIFASQNLKTICKVQKI